MATSSAPAAPGHPPPDLIGIDAPTLLQVESELSGKEVADPLRFVDLIERGFNLRAKLVRRVQRLGVTPTHRHMAALPMSGRPTGNFHLPLYSMTDSVSSPSAILSPCTSSPPARVVRLRLLLEIRHRRASGALPPRSALTYCHTLVAKRIRRPRWLRN